MHVVGKADDAVTRLESNARRKVVLKLAMFAEFANDQQDQQLYQPGC